LANVYGDHVDKAFVVDLKAAIAHGLGLAGFFFYIYGSYGLGESLRFNNADIALVPGIRLFDTP
jgi:hypothetical protein